MKTNVSIETSDEQRAQIARMLESQNKLASRNDIKEAVLKYIGELSIGNQVSMQFDSRRPKKAKLKDGSEAGPTDKYAFPSTALSVTGGQAVDPVKVYNERDFVPSRGDEPYLFRAQDEKLHKLHQDLLNAIDALNKYTWEKMEKNRVHG